MEPSQVMTVISTMFRFAVPVVFLLFTPYAHSMCFNEAAAYFQVSPQVLHAIAKHESGLNPNAMNRNTNGTYDIGVMQINSLWLPELSKIGIQYENLRDPCMNVFVGAWIYSKKVQKYGNSWNAIGAYHSETAQKRESYSWKIYREIYGRH